MLGKKVALVIDYYIIVHAVTLNGDPTKILSGVREKH